MPEDSTASSMSTNSYGMTHLSFSPALMILHHHFHYFFPSPGAFGWPYVWIYILSLPANVSTPPQLFIILISHLYASASLSLPHLPLDQQLLANTNTHTHSDFVQIPKILQRESRISRNQEGNPLRQR